MVVDGVVVIVRVAMPVFVGFYPNILFLCGVFQMVVFRFYATDAVCFHSRTRIPILLPVRTVPVVPLSLALASLVLVVVVL